MKRKFIITSAFFLFIIAIGFGFIKYHQMINVNRFMLESSQVLNDIDEQEYDEQITKLQEEYSNQDIVGTLEIENTDYKVPVLQSADNSFYLNHLPNKKYSFMGSIFLDYRVNIDDSRKLLIYGHNSSKYDMPFKVLENYYDMEYLNNHKYVTIKTKEKIRRYEIFSLYIETEDFKYMNVKFTDSTYKTHVKYLENKSMYNINTNIKDDDNILVLQTCSTHRDYLKYKKKYLVIAFHEINVN